MLLLYLGKLKHQKFALCMHVKHVLSVTFYYLCNRCLPNVMKINGKINTMQNTNILLFVRSMSLTYSRNAQLRYGPTSDRSSLTLQLTSAESVSRHVSVQIVDILNTFCEQTLANNLNFRAFSFQVASIHRVSF